MLEGPMTSAQPNPDLVHAYSAVVCDADGSTSLQQRQMMPPRTGELLLQLRMVGLCGTDLFKLATRSVTQGTVLGHELVGTVEGAVKGTFPKLW